MNLGHSITYSESYVAVDANGNVTDLVNPGGTSAAHYEYSPYGEVISSSGTETQNNKFRFSTKYWDDETGLGYWGYRYYEPVMGRWLSRDPSEEIGGLNLYEAMGNDGVNGMDELGLWGSDVHRGKTKEWAANLKMYFLAAETIADWDNEVDFEYDPTVLADNNWSWHFDRSNGGEDTRLVHVREELNKAQNCCSWKNKQDDWKKAANYLGHALHPLQDWVAHGDFNRRKETPYINSVGSRLEALDYIHNALAPKGSGGNGGAPDNPNLDANGPDGRATFSVLHFAKITSVGDRLYWAYFHSGHRRMDLTKKKTEEFLKEFQKYVLKNGKPCGECMNAFVPEDE